MYIGFPSSSSPCGIDDNDGLDLLTAAVMLPDGTRWSPMNERSWHGSWEEDQRYQSMSTPFVENMSLEQINAFIFASVGGMMYGVQDGMHNTSGSYSPTTMTTYTDAYTRESESPSSLSASPPSKSTSKRGGSIRKRRHSFPSFTAPSPPRSANAFILYRRQKAPEFMARHPDMPNHLVSRALGKQWKQESVEVKARFQALAREVSRINRDLYPTT